MNTLDPNSHFPEHKFFLSFKTSSNDPAWINNQVRQAFQKCETIICTGLAPDQSANNPACMPNSELQLEVWPYAPKDFLGEAVDHVIFSLVQGSMVLLL